MKSGTLLNTMIPVLLVITCLFTACKKDKEGYLKTESGLKYKFIVSNDGIKPGPGDVMIMSIIYKTPSDSILYNSAEKSDSFPV